MMQHFLLRGESLFRRALNWCTSPRVIYWIGEPFFWLLGRRQKTQELALSNVKHVLVVRLDTIGDVILTAPFLRELRRSLPYANITLLVKDNTYDLVELCPYVNEVLTYHSNSRSRFSQFWNHVRALRFAWKYLWKKNFELAIIPRWDVDFYHATFVAYFSGAVWRVGYSEIVTDNKKRTNAGFDRLLTHALPDKMLKHEVERNLDVIRFMGGIVQEDRLDLWLGKEDEAFSDNVLRKHGVRSGELVVGLCPSGGNSPLKQWPVINFIELGRWLCRQYRSHVIIVGGPGEEMLGRKIEHELGSASINMVGKTTLRQMAALLKRCHLYVGCDSGPMHIAAATGIPVVALFGASCDHRFGPWGNNHSVTSLALPCSPCFQTNHLDRCRRCIFDTPHCMLGITLEQVKGTVEAALSRLSYSVPLSEG